MTREKITVRFKDGYKLVYEECSKEEAKLAEHVFLKCTNQMKKKEIRFFRLNSSQSFIKTQIPELN